MSKATIRGIFMWDRHERVSDRYGFVYVTAQTWDGTATTSVFVEQYFPFGQDARVHITARVLESRQSGHIGDFAHNIFPTQPEVGEVVDLGVGTFRLGKGGNGETSFAIVPNDGRKRLWFDPRKLYRLHDQTVEITIESTNEEFSTAPDLQSSDAKQAFATDG